MRHTLAPLFSLVFCLIISELLGCAKEGPPRAGTGLPRPGPPAPGQQPLSAACVSTEPRWSGRAHSEEKRGAA
ncbi:unnamed protein product [Rangifer tarandus platyrhynchus]|uniref:Uncharacterized protein n=2 Tax=Rangifer tarandus platyrhynchus TaxID=3082113 RepID=A0ABN8YX28_RANTA|nr:unnamed protein product [Rangifer tarandus platyrhynchus]CAI9702084.1 unnamed protein product [Rangifer tarandus platyrhynchus]